MIRTRSYLRIGTTVEGVKDNLLFEAQIGKKCVVERHYWSNGEDWFKLRTPGGHTFDSPAIFWKSLGHPQKPIREGT